jgi:hypothetical protein
MSLKLTYWEDAKLKRTPDDYDGIKEVYLRSVKQIPELVVMRPPNCTMISTEYSGNHTRNGKLSKHDNPRLFKIRWQKGQPVPTLNVRTCPVCGHGL